MNWKHVKNLFLLLLVFVNVLLGIFVYKNYRETAFTDSLTAERTAELLRRDGIYVSETLLAAKNDEADTLSVPYDREEYLLTAAAFLLGGTPDGIYLLPNGIRAETAGGESVLLGNDLSVSFFAKDGGEAVRAELQKNRILPHTEEEAREILPRFATLLSLSQNEVESGVLVKGDGVWLLTLTQTADGIPLADFTCTFGMQGDRLVYAEGRHFFGAPTEREEAPLLNRVNILLKEREDGVRGTVMDVSLCYALFEETERGALLFIPAYRITYADGNVSTRSAISGDIVHPLALSLALSPVL